MYELNNLDEQRSHVITDKSYQIKSEQLIMPSDTPMFFGESEELYGVCRIPEQVTHSAGVLFCYTIGEEYIKKHRFFKELSELLIQRGMPVFKFDYLGIGDSMGDCRDWDMEIWSDNIVTAAGEFKNRIGIKKLHIVALGLGALLVTAAIKKGVTVDKLVLCDPVISGISYLDDLKKEHKKRIETQKKLFPFPKDKDLMIQEFEIKGFLLKPALQDAIAANNLHDFDMNLCREVKIIRSKKVKGFQLAFPVVQEKRRVLKAITAAILGDM